MLLQTAGNGGSVVWKCRMDGGEESSRLRDAERTRGVEVDNSWSVDVGRRVSRVDPPAPSWQDNGYYLHVVP